MEEQLVSIETADVAKIKKFNWATQAYHIDYSRIDISPKPSHWNGLMGCDPPTAIPTQSLLQRWLRETHRIHIEMIFSVHSNRYRYRIIKDDEILLGSFEPSYEEVLEDALLKALNLIQHGTN